MPLFSRSGVTSFFCTGPERESARSLKTSLGRVCTMTWLITIGSWRSEEEPHEAATLVNRVGNSGGQGPEGRLIPAPEGWQERSASFKLSSVPTKPESRQIAAQGWSRGCHSYKHSLDPERGVKRSVSLAELAAGSWRDWAAPEVSQASKGHPSWWPPESPLSDVGTC